MMTFNHKITNDTQAYGWGPVIIHWLIALAIIGLFPLGLYIEELDYYDPAYRIFPEWHKLIGLSVACAFIIRIFWRTFNKPPQPLPQPKWQLTLAHTTHLLLYLLLAVTLMSGYLISTADGRPITPFDWFTLPALPVSIENQEDLAGEVHEFCANALIWLSALHALAAIKHHVIDKDITLKRIFALRETHNHEN